MKKANLAISAITSLLITSGANAAPVTLSLDQMDSVAGGAAVSPIVNAAAAMHSNNGAVVNGVNTIAGPTVDVPVQATNGDGSGSLNGSFLSPGDPGYTAIFN